MTESAKRQILATVNLNFPSVSAGSISSLTATVKNVKPGDPCVVAAPALLTEGTRAQGTLTLDTNPANADTMTVGTMVYTFLTTLTGGNGEIKIGATLADTKLSLVKAFSLTGVAGTDYGAGMTAHPTVDIATFAGNVATLTAKVSGTAGNSIATTETFTPVNNVFNGATLGTTTSGVNPVAANLMFDASVTAEHTVTVRAINPTGSASDPAVGAYKIIVW